MRRSEQFGKSLPIRLALEIEHNATLVGIGVDKRKAALTMLDVPSERRQQTISITAGRLDLDNVGAQIGELTRRIRRWNIAQLDHSQMTERGVTVVIICHAITSN